MRPEPAAALGQGIVAGAIGYAVFVIFFATLNLVTGQNLFQTAHSLGSAIFGMGDPAGAVLPATVIAYNGIHLIASLTIGTIASFLVFVVDRHPALWWVVMFLLLAGILYSVAIGGVVANEIAGAVSWIQVVFVNILAAVLSGAYLWTVHPMLKDRVRRAPD